MKINQPKILLGLLPVWTPLTPPLGLACLKTFLQENGYDVVTADLSVNPHLKESSNTYFNTLKSYIPEEKRGNFFSIASQVLRNHMMVQIHQQEKKEYLELVRTIIHKTFYTELRRQQLLTLIQILEDFYTMLEKYLIHLLEKENPQVAGFSVYSDTLAASVFAFRLIKRKYPHILTVMGGGVFADLLFKGSPNYEFFLEKTRHDIDKIIIGEGEILFLELLRGHLPVNQRVFTLGDINGQLLDISSSHTAPLDLTDFNLMNYPYLVSYTSRSCPFQCGFCSETIQWGKYRRKKSKQIFTELCQLSRQYGSQLFLLSDSLLNPVITGISEKFVQSDVSIYWEGWLRVDPQACNPENALLWRRGGFYHARIGVESGSPRILKLMNKKITIEQVKESIVNLASMGIKTSTLWIIGYPGETEADFQQTLNIIEELKDFIYEVEGTPFWYYLSGQSNSEQWKKKSRSVLLYPAKAKDLLIAQTWILDCEPSREETFRRLSRFVKHQNKLGIPNIYSLKDLHQADQRWKMLHKNAVPALVEFKNNYFDECKKATKMSNIKNNLEDVAFGF